MKQNDPWRDNTAALRISIIIPTRNRPELMLRAVEAIKAQRHTNFEVIVVDDGSDAETRAVYPEYWNRLDARFRLELVGAIGQKGLGPSSARNHGISLARGEILAFCDDDDFWTASDHLQDMHKVFSTRPTVDMYIADQTGVSSRGVEIPHWLPSLSRGSSPQSSSAIPGWQISVDEMCAAGHFAHLNILAVRRRVVDEIQGFWESVGYEEDRDFFWRALDASRSVHFNPKIIAQHNIPDRSKGSNQSTRHSVLERWMISILVSQHISMSVKNRAIARLACRSEGDIFRHLCQHLLKSGQPAPALECAYRALAARFSFKWLVYLTLLKFKSLLSTKK